MLLPPPGKLLTVMTHPNTNIMALHQAHLASPIPIKVSREGRPAPELRLYQCVTQFALHPQLLNDEQSYFKWHIDIPAADFQRKAKDHLSNPIRPGSKIQREFREGSSLYRLRIVRFPKTKTVTTESDWLTSVTGWPMWCFVSLNDTEIDLRRKSHHGKDLPCDLTHTLREGMNEIEVSIHRGTGDKPYKYGLAVEHIQVMNHELCLNAPSLEKAEDALSSIMKSLQVSSTDDDDLEVVDAYISIDLVDPFLSKIFQTPVRGKTCIHRECFDLENYLNSRTTVTKNGPTSPDEWKCPICKKDARPQNLVIDGFLLQVKKELEASSPSGETSVRAIRVFPDGTYKPANVEEASLTSKTDDDDGAPLMASSRSTPSVSASKESVTRSLSRSESSRPVALIDLLDD